MHRRIGIGVGKGEESGFRYIGIQPPIFCEEASRILKIVPMGEWLRWSIDYKADVVAEDPPYIEFNIDVSKALEEHGDKTVDSEVMKLARSIGQILASKGDTYELVGPMVPTDFDNPIFDQS